MPGRQVGAALAVAVGRQCSAVLGDGVRWINLRGGVQGARQFQMLLLIAVVVGGKCAVKLQYG